MSNLKNKLGGFPPSPKQGTVSNPLSSLSSNNNSSLSLNPLSGVASSSSPKIQVSDLLPLTSSGPSLGITDPAPEITTEPAISLTDISSDPIPDLVQQEPLRALYLSSVGAEKIGAIKAIMS